MLVRFLGGLGFKDLVVQLNSVGDEQSRTAYRHGLLEYFEPLRSELSSDSQRRLDENTLRILDSKNPGDRELVSGAPQMSGFLSARSRQHFERVQALLDHEKVDFEIDPRLVRGLDYYTDTVFEIVSKDLGAQDAIVGGGRYDGLIEDLGGPPLPGIGFAIGEDRLIDILPKSFRESIQRDPAVFVVGVGEATASTKRFFRQRCR